MAKKDIDWEGVEREYRAGIRSLRDIAGEFGCTETAIRKRAKRDDWERDLNERVAAKAESLVRKAEVRREVRKSEQCVLSDNEQVQVSAQMMADKVINQRQDIKRARAIVQKLWDMVEAELDQPGAFQSLGKMMANPDENGIDKLNDMYHAAIGLPQQIKNAKLLADALKVLIELERKVLRIKDDPEPTATVVLKADPNLSPADAYMRMIGKK